MTTDMDWLSGLTVDLLKIDPVQTASADANGDGKTTVQDAIAALRFAVGLSP